jgi:16S rRNA (adenine1518-N6/adenine1519-N6)-dimethyltransferase
MILRDEIKTELAKLGVKPNKTLGQNFLVNEKMYEKIVMAADIKSGETIVEVGPGLGTLTGYLSQAGAEVIAVEKDGKLAEYLKHKFAGQKNVRIIEDDVLKLNPLNYNLQINDYKVVANIPYYLTSHLLRIIFESWPSPRSIVLMIQKEVAQRITAKPPKMSLLAVSVQYYAEAEIVDYVSQKSFYPAPKVDSAILKLTPNSMHQTNNGESEKIFKMVRAGFAGKRKQLVNNLASGLKLNKELAEKKLQLSDIDPRRRAETLTLEEWQKLTETMFSRD